MVGDIATGMLKAWHDRDVQSKILREGLFHKIAFLLVICMAQGMEYASGLLPQIELNLPVAGTVCAYIIMTEVVSIAENLKAINPDIGGITNRLGDHDEPKDKE